MLDVRNNLWCANRSTSNDTRRPGKTSHSFHVELAIKTACCSGTLQYRVPCGVLGTNWLDTVQYVCERVRESRDMRFQGIEGRKVPIELALLLVNKKNTLPPRGFSSGVVRMDFLLLGAAGDRDPAENSTIWDGFCRRHTLLLS
jgi:hypothetical protein